MTLNDTISLRWPLDIRPFEHEDRKYILIADPKGISEGITTLPAAYSEVLRRLDGSKSLAAILAELEQFGLSSELLLEVAEKLDELFLLDNVRASIKESELKAEFRALTFRKMSLAGSVYPVEPAECRSSFERYYTDAEEEGALPLPGGTTAVISPHIDYQRGWAAYARLHRRLRISEPYDLVVLFGTAHQPSQYLFHLSPKAFETPFGTMEGSAELVEQIAESYGSERCLTDEYLHKAEHSIELQLPFLCDRPDGKRAAILPILVGSFHSYFLNGIQPLEAEEVSGFVDSLVAALQSVIENKRVLFYAGVDLSHVGTHFGDEVSLDSAKLEALKNRDAAFLTAMLNGDVADMINMLGTDADASRICGYPSLVIMLTVMRRLGLNTSGGDLIDYAQAYDANADLAVSYASAFYS